MKAYRAVHDSQAEAQLRRIVAKVLKEYAVAGKFFEQFEEDYGCTLIFDEIHHECTAGIAGIWFHKGSNKTAFMLKYKL